MKSCVDKCDEPTDDWTERESKSSQEDSASAALKQRLASCTMQRSSFRLCCLSTTCCFLSALQPNFPHKTKDNNSSVLRQRGKHPRAAAASARIFHRWTWATGRRRAKTQGCFCLCAVAGAACVAWKSIIYGDNGAECDQAERTPAVCLFSYWNFYWQLKEQQKLSICPRSTALLCLGQSSKDTCLEDSVHSESKVFEFILTHHFYFDFWQGS